MEIRYTTTGYQGQEISNDDNLDWWLKTNLKHGGIESQIAKLQKLMVILTEKYLRQNPDRVRLVAEVIDCEGYNHQIYGEE